MTITTLQTIVRVYQKQLKTKLQQLIQEAYADPDKEPVIFYDRKGTSKAVFKATSSDVPIVSYTTHPNATALMNGIAKLIKIDRTGNGYAIEGVEKYFRPDTTFFSSNSDIVPAALTQIGINYLITQTEKGPQIDRLLHRYAAISQLEKDLEKKTEITTEIKEKVSKAVQICNENKPTWSEKPFLDKLKDIFSLGITLIFHKDDAEEFGEKVNNAKSPSKHR